MNNELKQVLLEPRRTSALEFSEKIHFDRPTYEHNLNKVVTNKYTLLNFVPKNLFEQFSNFINIYYLFVAFLQCLPHVSITHQKPIILIPLAILVALKAVKDFLEDFKRFKSDRRENNALVEQLEDAGINDIMWRHLCPGMIIKIE